MERSNFLAPNERRSTFRADAIANAPAWAQTFINEFRRRMVTGHSTAGLRPRDFARSGETVREVRAATPFVEQRAADGSSLVKCPMWVRQIVASYRVSPNKFQRPVTSSVAIERRRRLLLQANS